MCLDPSGRELWSTGADPWLGRGPLMALGGDHLLTQDGQSGMLRLFRARPEGLERLATANVFESEPKARMRMWAPLARRDDLLVARGRHELVCVRLGDARVALPRSGE